MFFFFPTLCQTVYLCPPSVNAQHSIIFEAVSAVPWRSRKWLSDECDLFKAWTDVRGNNHIESLRQISNRIIPSRDANYLLQPDVEYFCEKVSCLSTQLDEPTLCPCRSGRNLSRKRTPLKAQSMPKLQNSAAHDMFLKIPTLIPNLTTIWRTAARHITVRGFLAFLQYRNRLKELADL